ncbi:MAG TPA: hypothetical protein VMA55_09975 [Acidovorax sp.]|nr:hypothetical protein [Acidovorax sp.]
MAITVTLARSVSLAAYRRVEDFIEQLSQQNGDFKGRVILLARGSTTSVSDEQDNLRGALLQIMVDSVLEE